MSTEIFFHANVSPTAKLASRMVHSWMTNDTAIRAIPPTTNAAATILGFENRSSSLPTVRMPTRTPMPPAPIRFENEATPSPNVCRNTTRDSVRTIPCPIWSRVMDAIGPIARGLRRRRRAPSANSTRTRRSWCRRRPGSSGFVWGLRELAMRDAIHEAASQPMPAAMTTGAVTSTTSMTRPPTKTPASNATVPPTVAREFATRRSSCGTSRGTTAAAVDRKNRFTDMMRSAPAKKGIAWSVGSKSTSPTNAAFTHGANSRILRRRHRSMKTPTNGPRIE